MSGLTKTLLAGVAILGIASCSDLTSSDDNTVALAPAFQTVPVGFSVSSNSFDPSGDVDEPFFPGAINRQLNSSSDDDDNSGPGNNNDDDTDNDVDTDTDNDSDSDTDSDGFGGARIRGLLMGGGLHPSFFGGFPFGRGNGDGPFGFFRPDDDCTFDATSGRIECPDKVRRGLTVSSSFAFTDAAGIAQQNFVRGVTNSVNVQVNVEGTKTRHDGRVTSTVDHQGNLTVTGLAVGSTERRVNGSATAHESVTGTRDGVAFTAVRDASETITDVVIPVREGRSTIPTSGTIDRQMTITITPAGGTAETKSRRELITFNADGTISVAITQNGVTKNCTITPPRRKLVCQ